MLSLRFTTSGENAQPVATAQRGDRACDSGQRESAPAGLVIRKNGFHLRQAYGGQAPEIPAWLTFDVGWVRPKSDGI
jgi:hypothetical protein